MDIYVKHMIACKSDRCNVEQNGLLFKLIFVNMHHYYYYLKGKDLSDVVTSEMFQGHFTVIYWNM